MMKEARTKVILLVYSVILLVYSLHPCHQTFLNLTNFIENNNNIYDKKCVSCENIFYDESNDTNLIS
jgi:hypothetical protein